MNLFRQMLNEARFFLHDERSLRGYLIEDIEKKKLKAEELLNGWWYEIVADLRAMQYQPSINFKRSEND
jgi:superfamily I DNA and/or RNA helicase